MEEKQETQSLVEVYIMSIAQEVDILSRITKDNP